jgi:hypothetical protein
MYRNRQRFGFPNQHNELLATGNTRIEVEKALYDYYKKLEEKPL